MAKNKFALKRLSLIFYHGEIDTLLAGTFTTCSEVKQGLYYALQHGYIKGEKTIPDERKGNAVKKHD